MNIFNYLYKIPAKKATEILDDMEKNKLSSLPNDIVTDGEGNIYQIPRKGHTPLKSLEDDELKFVKFSYDWDRRCIDIYVRNPENELDANNYDYLTSYNVNASGFIDNPEYWFRVAYETAEDEIANEYDVKEAYELYGEVIDDEKDLYSYDIVYDVEFNAEDDEEYNEIENIIKNSIAKYDITRDIFGGEGKVNIKAEYDDSWGELVLHIFCNYPLTKEELMDYHDEFEEYVNKYMSSINRSVDLNIKDMFEN